ncbi:uncharacterized protein LOC101735358 isoform X1 [Bombyx mori]|uniref:uncharacterized protein LOC101735358 isoform X1 n=2 Tax=Bombyx mori TaxID=7091 RepID=UPI002ED218C9
MLSLVSCVSAQNGRGLQQHENNRHGWDIRIAVPGSPGEDYPTLSNIPRTPFSCAGREPGYYADFETNCQVFRVCTVGSTYGFQSFLCPNGTLFNQAVFVCDWWMNVNCRESEKLLNSKNEQFQNLRLGPELMKDIKKMLTYPMRNPYNKASMRSSLVVMQDYKAPAGQLFPNEALLAGPERLPSNVYVPKQNLIQNTYSNNENFYSESTSQPNYPNQYTTVRPSTREAEIFQRQRQTTPRYSNKLREEPNLRFGNTISNIHAGQFNQLKTKSNDATNTRPQRPTKDIQKNSQYFTKQTTTLSPNIQNTSRRQRGRQRSLNTDNKKSTNLSESKKLTNTDSVTNQKYTSNQQETQTISNQKANIRFNNGISDDIQNEVKQNIALVFSLLADSINAAKEYTNIAQQEVIPATPGTTQFQNVNEAELSQITNMISKLTSTQYADIYNRNENIITTPQNIPTNIQSNQLITVPEVTNQIYNRPFTSYIGQPANNPGQGNTANFIHSNIPQNAPSNFIPTANTQPQYSQDTNLFPSGDRSHDVTNLLNQSPAAVEIVQSQTLPYSSAKLQIGSSDQSTQTFNQETLANLLSGDNRISAHLQDKIIGTIKHPLESDKLVTYEKDQSYYFTSNLNKNTPGPNFSGNLIQPTSNLETKPSNTNFPNTLTLQFIPSNGYEVENERQQQKLLDTFQIDEFGAPREVVSNIDRSNNQEQILTSNIDYSIEHPTSARQLDGTNNINALYSGPSSYSAPQSSVVGGRSDRQNQYNSNLEDLDENNENGYPRTRPARQFTF